MDKLIHGTAADGTVRVLAAITTDTTAEAIRRHGTSPTASAALGRLMTGALLLGSTLKNDDRLTTRIECAGPIGGVTAEANAAGEVRGFVKEPLAEVPLKPNGKFDVSGIVGEGMLHVIREAGVKIGMKHEPYVGSVPITSGEIAEDLAYYLAKSEQIPSAVLLGVLLNNREPFVAASGGVLVQMMPGANDHIITMIEDTIIHAPHITEAIREGAGTEDLVKLALGVIDYEILYEKPVSFKCSCSNERALKTIASLGRDEIKSIIEHDGGATMHCGYCNESFVMSGDDLRQMLVQL